MPSAEVATARRKALGAFYTPRPMAQALVDWAVRSTEDRVLDPSFGGLVFLEAGVERLRSLGLPLTSASQRVGGIDIDRVAPIRHRIAELSLLRRRPPGPDVT
jgi:hypothetical protein